MKCTPKEVLDSIHNRSIHLDKECYIDLMSKNRIIFDTDFKGNGSGPFLILSIYKKHAKFTSGLELSDKEKYIFDFRGYDRLEDLSKDICDKINKYFKSFRFTRV